MFDAYHQWLGIPPAHRPPTHYQLLGIAPDEADLEVIKEAALRQTSHVRTYQTGPRTKECTQLLNEIAHARTTLLDAAARRAYDATFPRPTLPTAQMSAALAHASSSSTPGVGSIEPASPYVVQPPRRAAAPQQGFWSSPGAIAYLLLLFLVGIVAFSLTLRATEPSRPHAPAPKHKTSSPSAVTERSQ
jgi:hypothetical protein